MVCHAQDDGGIDCRDYKYDWGYDDDNDFDDSIGNVGTGAGSGNCQPGVGGRRRGGARRGCDWRHVLKAREEEKKVALAGWVAGWGWPGEWVGG